MAAHDVTHGCDRLARYRRDGTADDETHAAVRALVVELAEDAGGLPQMTNRELSLLEDVAFCKLIVRSAVDFALKQGSLFTPEGRLLPVLERSVLAFMNTGRLNLMALGLRPSRQKVADLEDYLATAHADEESAA